MNENILSKIEQLAEEYYSNNKALTMRKLVEELGVSSYTLAKYLVILEKEGKIKILRHGVMYVIVPNKK